MPHTGHSLPARGTTPGRMTAVMRAIAVTGPKVLRVGVVRGGRVITDLLLPEDGSLDVGTSERNRIVLPDGPVSLRLLESSERRGPLLRFTTEMSGKILLDGAATSLNELRQSGGAVSSRGDGTFELRLDEQARGKVRIGDTTLLFHLVTAPPVQPAPQLPISVLQGGRGIDWKTTMVGACCFLFHFLGLGLLYSDWVDPIVDTDLSTSGVVETVKHLPEPPPTQEPDELQEHPVEAPKAPKAETKATARNSSKASSQRGNGAMSAGEKANLVNEVERLELALLGVLDANAPATNQVLASDAELPTDTLDRAAKANAAVGVGGVDLSLPTGSRRVVPGQTGDLRGLGIAEKTGPEGSGEAKDVKPPPTGNANVPAPSVGGVVSNAAQVVAGMRPGFRSCYNRGLAQYPDAEGSIQLTIRVGPGGEVTGVSAGSSMPGLIVNCVAARARAAQFDAPEGGSAVVQVPVHLRKNRSR